MGQSSGFVPIHFFVAGLLLISFGIAGLFLVALSALTDWFKLPSIVLASSLALLPIGLYLLFIARRENNTNK
jgi:hypothetical protein